MNQDNEILKETQWWSNFHKNQKPSEEKGNDDWTYAMIGVGLS